MHSLAFIEAHLHEGRSHRRATLKSCEYIAQRMTTPAVRLGRVKTFVGLDVHRKLVVATALNRSGRLSHQTSFGSAPKDLVRFLKQLTKPVKVAMESCSVWERYYEAARSAGAWVVLSNPNKTRLISEASLKTDKVDSRKLADLLRLDALQLVHIPGRKVRAMRKLFQDRRFYSRLRSHVIQHLYGRLGEIGVDYNHNHLQRKHSRDKFHKLARPEVSIALDVLDDLEKHCALLDDRVHDAFVRDESAQLLSTIPGIGELTAVGLSSYLSPIDRFRDAKALTSYAGLCPTTYQSSDTSYHGHLKFDCNRTLRCLLIEASWRHRIHEPRGDVQRCAKRAVQSKGRMLGTVVGAHKLLRIIYAILKQGRSYRLHAPRGPASKQYPWEAHGASPPSTG